jgi:hypothetical protein
MLRHLLMGTAAGAVGTVALNVATYADMAIRGRPSSSVSAKMAGVLADKAGLPLSTGGEGSDDEKVQNRQSGLGALFGYVTGLGVGTAYGLLRPLLRGVPMPVAGVGVGLAAMAASDIPVAALGVSDPTTWGVSDWAADVVPHLAYGLVTAIAYDAFTGR